MDIAALIFALSVCQGQYLFPSSTDFGDLSFFLSCKEAGSLCRQQQRQPKEGRRGDGLSVKLKEVSEPFGTPKEEQRSCQACPVLSGGGSALSALGGHQHPAEVQMWHSPIYCLRNAVPVSVTHLFLI